MGAALFHMMRGTPLPLADDDGGCAQCGCRHLLDDETLPCSHAQCLGRDVDLDDPFPVAEDDEEEDEEGSAGSDYTEGLRDFVRELLALNRQPAPASADQLLGLAGLYFDRWRRDTPEGRLYVSLADDLRGREGGQAAGEEGEWPEGQARVGIVGVS